MRRNFWGDLADFLGFQPTCPSVIRMWWTYILIHGVYIGILNSYVAAVTLMLRSVGELSVRTRKTLGGRVRNNCSLWRVVTIWTPCSSDSVAPMGGNLSLEMHRARKWPDSYFLRKNSAELRSKSGLKRNGVHAASSSGYLTADLMMNGTWPIIYQDASYQDLTNGIMKR